MNEIVYKDSGGTDMVVNDIVSCIKVVGGKQIVTFGVIEKCFVRDGKPLIEVNNGEIEIYDPSTCLYIG